MDEHRRKADGRRVFSTDFTRAMVQRVVTGEKTVTTATVTVHYTYELGLVPITTPAYSPESNGLAEAFVHTFKRGYVTDADLRDAEMMLAQLGDWFEDYSRHAPFGARPAAALRVSSEARTHAPICLEFWSRPGRARATRYETRLWLTVLSATTRSPNCCYQPDGW